MTASPFPRETVAVVGFGFIGSTLARRSAASGVDTVVIRRVESMPSEVETESGLRTVGVDFSDDDAIRSSLDGVDRVFWCAGGPLPAESEADTVAAIEQRNRAIETFLRVLRSEEVPPPVVLFSSGGTVCGDVGDAPVSESVVPRPVTAYGIASLCGELLIGRYEHLTSTRCLILRCGNVYGGDQPSGRSQGVVANAIDAALSGSEFQVFGDGSTVRDYVHIDDVVEIALRVPGLVDCPPVVNVGTGVGGSVLDVVAAVEDALGVEIPLRFEAQRDSDLHSVVLDNSLLRSLIDIEFIGLRDGVRRTIEGSDRGRHRG